jgi:hypothetical protein
VKAIARLFADLGDSYVDLIVTGNVIIPASCMSVCCITNNLYMMQTKTKYSRVKTNAVCHAFEKFNQHIFGAACHAFKNVIHLNLLYFVNSNLSTRGTYDCYTDGLCCISGSNEAMLIVQALLEVTSHSEFDISSMTYNFWHNLQAILTRRYGYEMLTYFRPLYTL